VRRTYGYVDCPYFKVDVEFTASGANDRGGESGQDVITKLSRPYLDSIVVD
jgi:hypothetical protein